MSLIFCIDALAHCIVEPLVLLLYLGFCTASRCDVPTMYVFVMLPMLPMLLHLCYK